MVLKHRFAKLLFGLPILPASVYANGETDISISANPAFDFYTMPQQRGELTAEITDNHGQVFSKTATVGGS